MGCGRSSQAGGTDGDFPYTNLQPGLTGPLTGLNSGNRGLDDVAGPGMVLLGLVTASRLSPDCK